MLNSFLGIGRLGHDAELATTRNGHPMAKFSIAVDRNRPKGTEGEPDWIRCHLFGERAQLLAPYLTKGTLVGVNGRLETFKTLGDEPRRLYKVNVAEINFLDRPSRQAQPEPASAAV